MVELLCLGEVLLRLAPPGCERLETADRVELAVGGAAMNVGAALIHLGRSARMLTALPALPTGDRAMRELRAEGFDTSAVVRCGERMGLYWLEVGALDRPSRVTYDRAGSSFATLDPEDVDWSTAFDGVERLHWTGITPPLSRSAEALVKRALDEAATRGVRISVDLNIRSRLWSEDRPASAVMPALVGRCSTLIGNESDVAAALGLAVPGKESEKESEEESERVERCRTLVQRLRESHPGLETIALTIRRTRDADHGELGGLVAIGDDIACAEPKPIGPHVDRIGSGDAFSAGVLLGQMEGQDAARTLQLALTAGRIKHSIPGDILRLSRAELSALAETDTPGRVQR